MVQRTTSLLNIAAMLALIAFTGLGVSCTESTKTSDATPDNASGASKDENAKEEAVPVEVVTLESGAIEAALRFSANLEAENQVQVLSRSAGLVTNLAVEEGSQVQSGEVLLRIEDKEQKSQLARTTNDLEQARRERDRQQRLHDRGVSSAQAAANAAFEFRRLRLLREDAARAVRDTVVRAPISGTVTQRLVQRGDNLNMRQPLFQITDFQSLVARVYVPEKELVHLRQGLEARILAPATGGAGHEGIVHRIAPLVDPKSGTVAVTVAIPQPEGLLPGMFVDVALVTQRRDQAVLLPKRALVYDNEVPYAFKLVDGNRVERVEIVPALEDRAFVEPAHGFKAGDQVVIAGQVGLKDKALVKPQVASTDTAPETAAAHAGDQPKDTSASTDTPAQAGSR